MVNIYIILVLSSISSTITAWNCIKALEISPSEQLQVSLFSVLLIWINSERKVWANAHSNLVSGNSKVIFFMLVKDARR